MRQVVWDWNGTLFDDRDCCVAVTNQLLAEYHLPLLGSLADYQRIFRFPVADYYADLGFDTSATGNFAAAAARYVELYLAAATGCSLHQGAVDQLQLLQQRGYGQIVISASEQDALRRQLEPFGLMRWLDAAHGRSDIQAATKLDLARSWFASAGLDPKAVWFVGDSAHDFEVATALGANCVLFSGGHQSPDQLLRLGVPVVARLEELGQVLPN